MPEGALIDRLDEIVTVILRRGDASAALRDPELAPLARVAAGLRHYPRPEFIAGLRAQLERRAAMSATLVAPAIRQGFTTVTPYLRVEQPGLPEFLTRVFDAEETFSARGSAGGMHREMRIGNSMIMIGEGGSGSETVMPIRPAALHVYVPDADRTFERAIAAGATSLGAPADRPYGERAGFVKDPSGNHWYIATAAGPSPVPEGLETVTPFLHVRAARDQAEFLKRAFHAVEESWQEAGGRIRYARLRIGNAAVELGEAEGEPMPGAFYLYVGDVDTLYRDALAAGATSLWAPADQPYGDRVGAVEDSAGNQWFIARPGQTA